MLTILYYTPLVSGADMLFDVNVTADDVQKVEQSFGGYWSLEHRFNCSHRTAEDWMEEGVGRHVELYGPETTRIWEGFVDEVEVNIGSLTVHRGPLLDTVANRVIVAYSTVDTSTDVPTVGIRAFTAAANNTTSQGKYGIIERIVSVGGATPAAAEQIRDTVILEYAEPATSEADNLESSTAPSVSLTCLGYYHWLKAYTVDLTTTGEQDADAKVQAVLAADPNGFFSADYSYIGSNTVQVGAYDRDRRPAEAVIKGITALGGTTNERWLFGFRDGRVAYYKTMPDAPIYQRRLAEPEQRVERWLSGQRVKPWNVKAGEWIFYSDLLAGRPNPATADKRTDPRYMFIEEADYSTPWSLTLTGSRAGKLDQVMAQYGLGGTVA